MGRRGANKIQHNIFSNSLLNISSTIYDFFIPKSLFVLPKPSGFLHVAWYWQKYKEGKCKLTQSYVPTVKLLQYQPFVKLKILLLLSASPYSGSPQRESICKIENKNTKSDGCVGFTRLQRKWPQYLHNM